MKVSIIIPAINEANNVRAVVENAWSAGADEVILVDGGSSDDTLEIARSLECQALQSQPGRGIQLNVGAALASGDVLLFLHADTRIAPDVCAQVRSAVARGCIGGALKQQIDHAHWIYRWIEWGNGLRARFQKLIYGDQGLFVTRQVFETIGGFEPIPIMEDYVFSRRLRGQGNLCLLPGPIHVSARRWEKAGPIRQTVRNWIICFRFRWGATPDQLLKSYRRHDL